MKRWRSPQRPARRHVSWWWLVVIIAAVSVTVAAGAVLHDRAPNPASYEVLDRLAIVDRSTEDPTYRRAAFGRSWADLDGDGCNTRDEVLLATVVRTQPYRAQPQGRCRADMVAGTWTDIYTGQSMTWSNLKDISQAEAIPLDHIVSLAGSYRYGAKNWTQQRRIEFANDELNLSPTTAKINRAKSDGDPVSWTPPALGRCPYATRYIAVKARWDLPVDRAERDALRKLLHNCPGQPR